jgi:hypothetical protein
MLDFSLFLLQQKQSSEEEKKTFCSQSINDRIVIEDCCSFSLSPLSDDFKAKKNRKAVNDLSIVTRLMWFG